MWLALIPKFLRPITVNQPHGATENFVSFFFSTTLLRTFLRKNLTLKITQNFNIKISFRHLKNGVG
ncbi:MAG: hypothetical protein ACI9V1_000546 [Spirosomataceae bacterium]|jgi:hypothetical protein